MSVVCQQTCLTGGPQLVRTCDEGVRRAVIELYIYMQTIHMMEWKCSLECLTMWTTIWKCLTLILSVLSSPMELPYPRERYGACQTVWVLSHLGPCWCWSHFSPPDAAKLEDTGRQLHTCILHRHAPPSSAIIRLQKAFHRHSLFSLRPWSFLPARQRRPYPFGRPKRSLDFAPFQRHVHIQQTFEQW